eukprot:764079-Hanusia_phi.AAC.3
MGVEAKGLEEYPVQNSDFEVRRGGSSIRDRTIAGRRPPPLSISCDPPHSNSFPTRMVMGYHGSG